MLKTCNWHLKLLKRFSRHVSTTAARPASTPGAHSPSPPRPLARYVCCAALAWPISHSSVVHVFIHNGEYEIVCWLIRRTGNEGRSWGLCCCSRLSWLVGTGILSWFRRWNWSARLTTHCCSSSEAVGRNSLLQPCSVQMVELSLVS